MFTLTALGGFAIVLTKAKCLVARTMINSCIKEVGIYINMIHQLLLSSIPFIDFFLTKTLGKTSRWFQLHAVVNLMIMYLVIPDTLEILIRPSLPLPPRSPVVDMALTLVCGCHMYHFVIETLTPMEIWHHVLFVAMSIPAVYYFQSQIIAPVLFAGCGFPGAIEYTMLSLVKHKRIMSITQKRVSSWINNYIRGPIGIYSATIAYVDTPISPVVYYVCFLIYLNSTIFSKMAVEKHMWHHCILMDKYNGY